MRRFFILCLVIQWFAIAAFAAEKEGVVDKAERGVKKGAEAAAKGIEIGAEAASNGVKKGVEATGKGLKKAGDWVDEKVGGRPTR
jgi:hypothetical protein